MFHSLRLPLSKVRQYAFKLFPIFNWQRFEATWRYILCRLQTIFRETKNLFKGIARRYRWNIFHGWGFPNCGAVVRKSWLEQKIGTTMVKARYRRKDSSRKDTIAMISWQRSRNDPRTWPYSRKQGCTISFCQHAAGTGFKIESFVVEETRFSVFCSSRGLWKWHRERNLEKLAGNKEFSKLIRRALIKFLSIDNKLCDFLCKNVLARSKSWRLDVWACDYFIRNKFPCLISKQDSWFVAFS